MRVDIHLDYNTSGKRFVKRVSEIVPVDEGIEYEAKFDKSNPYKSQFDLDHEYYERVTDRVSFTTHDIMLYDENTDTYYTVDRFSEATENHMLSRMDKRDAEAFILFMLEHWGARPGTPEAQMTPEELADFIEERRAELGREANITGMVLEEETPDSFDFGKEMNDFFDF